MGALGGFGLTTVTNITLWLKTIIRNDPPYVNGIPVYARVCLVYVCVYLNVSQESVVAGGNQF